MFGYTWKIRGIVFLGNILIIGLALFFGFLVSYYFQVSRLISMVAALIISFPINQLLVSRYAVKVVERGKNSTPVSNLNN